MNGKKTLGIFLLLFLLMDVSSMDKKYNIDLGDSIIICHVTSEIAERTVTLQCKIIRVLKNGQNFKKEQIINLKYRPTKVTPYLSFDDKKHYIIFIDKKLNILKNNGEWQVFEYKKEIEENITNELKNFHSKSLASHRNSSF